MKNVSISAILKKFLNKTFQAGKSQDSKNPTVLIKTKICEIFGFLLRLRQEYLLSNAFHFFTEIYLPEMQNKSKMADTDKLEKSQSLIDKVSMIFPDIIYEAGQTNSDKGSKSKSRFRTFDQDSRFEGFDSILGKSFLQVLMLGFYFAKDSKLQTSFLTVRFSRVFD